MDRRNPFFGQAELLVRVLPFVAKQECFGLKGGTAINLFVRDLPRLSVDIDLAYLLRETRETALVEIRHALSAIEVDLREVLPGANIQATDPNATESLRLTIRSSGHQVKIEVSPVLRGTVWPCETREVVPIVEETFGYAEMQVLSERDLFAGKICAALDRQHPRDLFDMKLLLENEGIDRELFKTFLVYLISHRRPMAELLSPNLKEIAPIFESEFQEMTRVPVTLDELVTARQTLLTVIRERMTAEDRAFLLSVKGRTPDWRLLGLEGVADLPVVQWKLINLERMEPARHRQALDRLKSVLDECP